MFSVKSLIAVIIGGTGAIARLLSEYMDGSRVFVWWHLGATMLVGGFLGFMGGELAHTLNLENWSNIFAGAFGASGAYGFEVLIKKVTKKVE